MLKTLVSFLATVAVVAPAAIAQSPARETTVTVAGKTLRAKYGAPSVRGRKIFGPGGLLSQDPTYPVWRAGANSATSFHTDADLDIGGLTVPKGDYTLYADVSNPDAWQLVISKQTGQWGLTYDAKQDLGRVKMTMSKPPALVEQYKMTLAPSGTNAATLQLEWENHVASVPIRLK